jgi:hypothetical protein
MGTSSYSSSRLIERRASGGSSFLDAIVALVVAIVATAMLVSFRAGPAWGYAASMLQTLIAG